MLSLTYTKYPGQVVKQELSRGKEGQSLGLIVWEGGIKVSRYISATAAQVVKCSVVSNFSLNDKKIHPISTSSIVP